jgi:hypothetical protein
MLSLHWNSCCLPEQGAQPTGKKLSPLQQADGVLRIGLARKRGKKTCLPLSCVAAYDHTND